MSCKLGDVRKGPDEQTYACFKVDSRSSSWIARDATVRQLYHDTERWSDVRLPLCDEYGCLTTCGGRLRLERAMAIAWLPAEEDGYRATLVRCDREVVPENVTWVGVRRRAPTPTTRIPPCVEHVVAVASTHTTIDSAYKAAGLRPSTFWNYLAKGVALHPDVQVCAGVQHLVDERLKSAYASLRDRSGSMKELIERMPQIEHVPEYYNQLRVLRRSDSLEPSSDAKDNVSQDVDGQVDGKADAT